MQTCMSLRGSKRSACTDGSDVLNYLCFFFHVSLCLLAALFPRICLCSGSVVLSKARRISLLWRQESFPIGYSKPVRNGVFKVENTVMVAEGSFVRPIGLSISETFHASE